MLHNRASWKGSLPLKVNSRAGVAVSSTAFSSVRFSGTIFVDSSHDNDLIGIIFSYQNHKNFYALTSSMTGSQQVWYDRKVWYDPRVHFVKTRIATRGTGSWQGSSQKLDIPQWNCRLKFLLFILNWTYARLAGDLHSWRTKQPVSPWTDEDFVATPKRWLEGNLYMKSFKSDWT